jgi:hypothetical protein
MRVSPRDYQHPEDKAALENLKSIPLFSSCVRMFMKHLPERVLHGTNMAEKIRLGPRQLPEIYEYLPEACKVLGITEPEFYLEAEGANAYTVGVEYAFITVTSGLIANLEEDEIRAVVAHECGHIACEHTLYQTMAQMLLQYGTKIFGPLAAVSAPVQMALLYWYRRSEFSADRAAAIVVGGSGPVVDTMVRLAGGPKSLTEKVDLDQYLMQAEDYDKMMDSAWDQVLQGLAIWNQNHPFPAVRAREIVRWCEGEHFQRLMQGMSATGAKCPFCGSEINESWKFCRSCGAANPNVYFPMEVKEATDG